MSNDEDCNLGKTGNYILHLSLTSSVSETKSRFLTAQDVDKRAIKEEGWVVEEGKPTIKGVTKHKATSLGAPPELRRALHDIAEVRANLKIKVREYAMCKSALLIEEIFQ